MQSACYRKAFVSSLAVVLSAFLLPVFGRADGHVPFSEAAPALASPLRAIGQTSDGVVILDEAALASFRAPDSTFIVTGFVLDPETTVELLLSRAAVMASDADVVVGSDSGDQPLPLPDFTLLRGQVLGKPRSLAYLGFITGSVYGFVVLDDHTYIVSSGPPGEGLPPLVYDADVLGDLAIDWAPFQCLLDDTVRIEVLDAVPDGSDLPAGGDLPCRVAQIAVETDWEYTGSIFGGDVQRSAAYALMLWGAVSEIYTRDAHTRLRISYLRVWDSDVDPYAGGGLGEFQNYWNANMGHVARNAAHLLSSMYGGGVAYLPGLCNWGYEYGLSGALSGYFPYPLEDHRAQNWDPFVVSHELGHNFGAPHTHDHTPPIDGCGLGDCSLHWYGTIMSYCHGCRGGMANISLRLHERTLSEAILPYLDRLRSCDLEGDPDCDVRCDEVLRFRAKCNDRGILKLRLLLTSDLHSGQRVAFSANGTVFVFPVVGDRVVQKICCLNGAQTIMLESPSGCALPIEVTCR